MDTIRHYLFVIASCCTLLSPLSTHALATLLPTNETFEKAKVLQIVEKKVDLLPGTDISSPTQTLKVQVLSGDDKGKIITFTNDYTQLAKDDVFYIRKQTSHDSTAESWTVSDPYRLDTLASLVIIFILLIFLFGGIQGVRGLASLIGSLVLIFYALIPGLYAGYNAILISIGVASLIIVIGSYITHGWNRTTSSAVIGMITTVLVTGIIAYYVVIKTKLSGYTTDESVFLMLNTKGSIDIVGLLYGGIIIGLLGVLYDSAIGQAVAIEELYRAGKHMTKREIYERGIRIGREHIGALVNTLAIAYVGASLPLFLLIQNATASTLFIINSEIFATEIIRILIGSIGLILAVPITTLIATHLLHGKVHTSSSSHVHTHHH